jgi:integrase/recombinase XerD
MEALTTTTQQPTALALTGNATYDPTVREFNAFADGRPVTADLVREFYDTLKAKVAAGTIRPSTVNVKKSALRKSLDATFAAMADSYKLRAVIDQFFKAELKSYKTQKSVTQDHIPDGDATDKIAQAAPERIAVLVETLAATGLRIAEALSLRMKHATQQGKVFSFKVIGKGRKERTVFLPETLVAKIRKAYGSETDILFAGKGGNAISRQYAWREIAKYSTQAIGQPVHPHTFRHSFATRKIKQGYDIAALSRYLGHSTTAITLDMYVHTAFDAEAALS